MPDLSESVHVQASAGRVYALVSDLPRMGEWSPECTRVRWHGDVTGPTIGARFTGYNRSGRLQWSTTGTVVQAEPGRAFAFEIALGPVRSARWAYLITPDDDTEEAAADGADTGCTVTEEWTDRRPGVFRVLMNRALGNRRDLNRAGILETLKNLKAAAEESAG